MVGWAYAQTEVYSVNVVGFQRLTAVTGLTLVATPFIRTNNTLDGVIGGQLTPGKSSGLADNILMWDPIAQRYDTYWLKSSDSNWYTLAGARATNPVTPSHGMFVLNRRTTNQVIIVSGDVPNQAAITNQLVPGLNMVSYPFSTDIDINSSQLTNGRAGKTSGQADSIYLWNATSKLYETYWLKTDRKWYTIGGVLASNVRVGGGRAFWYLNRTNTIFSWVESRPYTF